MKRRNLWALLVGVCCLGLACGPKPDTTDAGTGGGVGGGVGGGTGGGLTIAAYCSGQTAAYCDALARCGRMDPAFRTECTTYLAKLQCAEAEESVARGTARFDGERAATCLEQYKTAAAASCDVGLYLSYGCQGLFTGIAQAGQSCNIPSDCADSKTVCTGAGCSSVCTPWGGLNQPCRYGSCNSGFWCDSQTQLCKAPQPAGSTCTSSSNTYNPQCDNSSYCDTAMQKCVALPTSGQPCRVSSYPYCAENLYCDYTGGNLCKPFLALDGGCAGNSQACGPDAKCSFVNSNYHCTAKGNVGAGCTYSPDCLDTLRCVSGSCQTKATLGQSCQDYGDCVDSLYCDPISKRCEQSHGVDAGQPCTDYAIYCNDAHCEGAKQTTDGGVGTFGVCTPPGPGTSCTANYDCGNGTFCGDAGTCQLATVGSPCNSGYGICAKTDYCATSKTCQPKGDQGAACPALQYSDEACRSPYVCVSGGADAGSGICGTPGAIGAACVESGYNQCVAPGECINGVCTKVGTAGAPCTGQGGYCYNGACSGRNEDAGVRGTCAGYRAVGQPCEQGFECDTGNCDTTTHTCVAACF